MERFKKTACLLLVLFCAKLVVANQATGKLFFGDDFQLVRTMCQNREKPKTEDPSTPDEPAQQTCATLAFDLLFMEEEEALQENPSYLATALYFYATKSKLPVTLAAPSPPPKKSIGV